MHDYTWIPKEARGAAERFRLALRTDRHSHSASVRMIRAIVDHARAVRLRCDATDHLRRLRKQWMNPLADPEVEDHDLEQARIVHGLARFTADMTRRDLPRLPVGDPNVLETDAEGFVIDHVRESTRDAGHDLLAALICDVDAEAGHG